MIHRASCKVGADDGLGEDGREDEHGPDPVQEEDWREADAARVTRTTTRAEWGS